MGIGKGRKEMEMVEGRRREENGVYGESHVTSHTSLSMLLI